MPSQEFTSVIQILKSLPKLQGLTFKEERIEFEKTILQFPVPEEEDVISEPLSISGISAEWLRPPIAANDAVILYLHGGGYVKGSINTHRGMVARISKASQTNAVIIDYRLAPEHPFPAALEDSTAAYTWLLSEGIPANRIVIAGDSAGGGLSMATLLKLKELKEPMPAAVACISPWLDLEGTGESFKSKADLDPICNGDSLLKSAAVYLGDENPQAPLVSPIYGNLQGLPPILIHVGTSEILLDDSKRLAERAKKDGVEVVLEIWEEMIHSWHFFAFMLPEGRKAIAGLGNFIMKYTR